MNKQPGSTISTSINGTRSCYVTTKRFAFLTVGTILAYNTKDISNNILNWLWALFEIVNPLTKRQEKNLFDLQKKYCALGTQAHIADIDNRFCQEIEKFFVQEKFTRTLCISTTHVPNKSNSAMVISTMRGECTTHCNCSQLFQTCLQRNIGSCRDGEFQDG